MNRCFKAIKISNSLNKVKSQCEKPIPADNQIYD